MFKEITLFIDNFFSRFTKLLCFRYTQHFVSQEYDEVASQDDYGELNVLNDNVMLRVWCS